MREWCSICLYIAKSEAYYIQLNSEMYDTSELVVL